MDAQTFFNGQRYAIEFQHSHISTEEIMQREAGYKNMIWVFDCIGKLELHGHRDGFVMMYWSRPRESIFWCNSPVLLDIGSHVIQVVSMPEYRNDYWYGCECYSDEMQATLTTGKFVKDRTTALEKLITEGAA
jgi:hypothetical protein